MIVSVKYNKSPDCEVGGAQSPRMLNLGNSINNTFFTAKTKTKKNWIVLIKLLTYISSFHDFIIHPYLYLFYFMFRIEQCVIYNHTLVSVSDLQS